jgi:hypothetical protein
VKRRNSLWVWWWELPGSHWWFPDPIFGHDMIWSINERGVVAWPGMIRCLFKPHTDDSYGNCCYCGKSLKQRKDLRDKE